MYAILEYLGDIGGLYDILIILVGVANGFLFEAYLRASIVKNLFIYKLPKSLTSDLQSRKGKKKSYRKIFIEHKELRLTMFEKAIQIFFCFNCCLSGKSKRRIKAIDRVSDKVNDLLDIK